MNLDYYESVANWLGETCELPTGSTAAEWTNKVHTELVKRLPTLSSLAGWTAWSKAFGGDQADDPLKHGEYLVDLTVCREVPNCAPADLHSGYQGILLAAETEWNPSRSAIWTDLVKLTDVHATYRVFVGGLRRERCESFDLEAESIAEEINNYCRSHLHFAKHDTMLAFFWDYLSPGHSDYCSWVFGGAGEITSLKQVHKL